MRAFLFLHPVIAELLLAGIAFVVGSCLSYWGALNAYIAIANKKIGMSFALVWHGILCAYFSWLLFALLHAALIDLGVSQYDLDRVGFAAGNWPLILFFLFLVAGTIVLFLLIRRTPVFGVEGDSLLRRIWDGIGKTILAALFGFVVLIVLRIPSAQEREISEAVVRKIQEQKITLADALGKNLPSEPDQKLDGATIEGIDVNRNDIRDSVELVIFGLHPDSPRIRAAELQYAQSLQNELTMVFDSATWSAALERESLSWNCLQVANVDENEVKDLVLNTDVRKRKREEIFINYESSFALPNGISCDIDPSTF